MVGVFLDDVGAGDVGRHQVGRELDAVEVEVEDVGHRLHDERLGEAGHAGDDAVAADEQRQHDLVEDLVLADDLLAQLVEDRLVPVAQAVGEGDVGFAFEPRQGVGGGGEIGSDFVHVALHGIGGNRIEKMLLQHFPWSTARRRDGASQCVSPYRM